MSLQSTSYSQVADAFDPRPNDIPITLAIQPDGKVLFGGQFTYVSNQPRPCLARVNADGTLDWSFPTAGSVYAIALQGDGKVLVGGSFGRIGDVPRSNIARIHPNGAVDTSFNAGADAGVWCIVLQPDGKILVGGSFTNIAGAARARIARLNEDGTVDPTFAPVANEVVSSIILQPDEKILVSGRFTTLAGQARTGLGRLQGDGTLDTSFNPVISGAVFPPMKINSVLQQPDGKILLGGNFERVNSFARTNIARLNGDGSIDASFNPGANHEVCSMALQTDGKIILGGGFTVLAGQTRYGLGRLNPTGTLDTSFDAAVSGKITAVALQPDGKIVACGEIGNIGGQPQCVARFSNTAPATQTLTRQAQTVRWMRGGTGPEISRAFLEVSTDGLGWTALGTPARIAGGWELPGVSLPKTYTLRARGFLHGGLYQGSGGVVEMLSGSLAISRQPASRSVTAGTFATLEISAGGGTGSLAYQWRKDETNLANGGNMSGVLTPTLSISNALGSDAGSYTVLVTSGSEAIVSQAAQFTVVDPYIYTNPASLWVSNGQVFSLSVAASGTLPLNYEWRKDGESISGATSAALSRTNQSGDQAGHYEVVVSSSFGSVTSSTATVGTTDPFNPVVNGTVYCTLVQPDGRIVIGGSFTSVGGLPRTNLARLHPDGSLDLSFSGTADAKVCAIALQQDGRIVAGGAFGKLSGQSRAFLGRLNTDGSLDGSFAPVLDGRVNALLIQPNGGIVVGGVFRVLNTSCNYLGLLRPNGTRDAAFNPSPNGEISSLAMQPDGRVLAAGLFRSVQGQPRMCVARLLAGGGLDTSFFDPRVSPGVSTLVLQPDGKVLIGGNIATVNDASRPYIARLNANGTLDSDFVVNVSGGIVNSMVLQADGRIVLAGTFNSVNDQHQTMARLFPDGSLDRGFNPTGHGTKWCLALQQDGKLLVGGFFSSMGEEPRSGLCRLNPTEPAIDELFFEGSSITWLRGGSGPEVTMATLSASTNGSTWFDLGQASRITHGWRVDGTALPSNPTIRVQAYIAGDSFGSSWYCQRMIGPPVIEAQPVGSVVLAGAAIGLFVKAVGPEPLSYQWYKDGLALVENTNLFGIHTAELRLTNISGADRGTYWLVISNSFGARTSQSVLLEVQDPFITQQPASFILLPGAAGSLGVSAQGSAPLSYYWRKDGVPMPNGTSALLTFTNAQGTDAGYYDVIVSNSFGSLTSTVAVLTVNAVTADNLNPGANSHVYALAQGPDGSIIAGGAFTNFGGEVNLRLASLNRDGSRAPGFVQGANDVVRAVGVQTNGQVIVAGDFTSLGGQTIYRIGRMNLANGSLDTSFNPSAGAPVRCLALRPDGKILIGGDFGSISTQACSRLALLTADGTLEQKLATNMNGSVLSLAMQPDGKFIAGGSFTLVDSIPRNRLARYNADGSLDLIFTPNIQGSSLPGYSTSFIYALLVQPNGQILIGGDFSSVNGQPRTNLARLNPDGSLDVSFRADAVESPNPYVQAFSLQADGKIVLAGLFNRLGGLPRAGIGRLYPDGRVDPSFDPGKYWNWDYSLALQSDGKLVVGGYFYNIGGQNRDKIARLEGLGPATNELAFDSSSVTWLRAGSATELWHTRFELSTNGVDWTALGNGIRIVDGWHITGLSLPPKSLVRARGYVAGGNWFAEEIAGEPIFVSNPYNITNNAGGNAAFTMSAAGGQPISYQWLKDGIPLQEIGNASGTQTRSLLLTNVLGGDSGNYQLVASNRWGSTTSEVAYLSVRDPYVTSHPTSQSKNSGQSASLSVQVNGTQPLRYEWFFNGAALDANTQTLALTNLQAQDAGSYSVVVSNSFGMATSSVAVLGVNLAFPDAFNPGQRSFPYAIAIQRDHKLLIGGNADLYGNALRQPFRLNPDGSLDLAFNTATNTAALSGVVGIAIQPDDKILTFGYSRQKYPTTLRLFRDGSPDQSFTNTLSATISAMLARADGKIWLAGSFSTNNPAVTNLALLNADGSLNTNFACSVGTTPGSAGTISLAEQIDGKLLVWGSLTIINGSNVAGIARLNPNGSLDTSFSTSVSGTVYSVLIEPSGRMLVGGQFGYVNGAARKNICRLNADGSLDPTFDPKPTGSIYSMALQADGKIIIGGAFTFVGDMPPYNVSRVARLNSDGTMDLNFNPSLSSQNTVYALALQPDGALLIAGSFNQVNGQWRTNFARLLPTHPATQDLTCDGSVIRWQRGGTAPEVWRTTFEYSANGTDWTMLGAGERVPGGWRFVTSSLPPGANVRARGYYTGAQYNRCSWFTESIIGPAVLVSSPSSRTNNAGTTAAFWISASGDPGIGYAWYKDGELLSNSQHFSGANGPMLSVSNVFGADGGNYWAVISNAGRTVTSAVARLTVNDPVITRQPVSVYTNAGQYVSFSVLSVGTEPSYQWRKNGMSIPGATASALPIPSPQAGDIAAYSVVISNSFGAVTSATANLMLNLALPDSLNPALNDEVRSVALQPDGKILVGGNFDHLGEEWFWEFGRLNQDGSRDTNFSGHVNSAADTIAVQPDGKILVGGWFTYANDWPHSQIARFNPDGSLDPSVNPTLGGSSTFVDSLVPQPDGKILVGGWFTSIAAQARTYMGRLNGDGSLDSFNLGANSHVMVMALQSDGKIVVGGNFTTLAGQPRNRIGRVNPEGWIDGAFNPGAGSTVNSVVVQPDGKILVGGSFTTLANAARYYLGRLKPDGSLDTSFFANVSGGSVSSIALQADGSVLIAGSFMSVGGQSRTGLARVGPTGAVDPTFSPQVYGGVGAVTLQPDGKILIAGSFTNVCGQPRTRLARIDSAEPAEHSLICDARRVTWVRKGAVPEVSGVWFETSPDGTNWLKLPSAPTRVADGWQLPVTNLTVSSHLRARGYASGGRWNGSLSLIEDTARVTTSSQPVVLSCRSESNQFSMSVAGLPGQAIVIEASTDLIHWVPVQTNLVTDLREFIFTDAASGALPRRFYRAKVHTGSLPAPSLVADSGIQAGAFGINIFGTAGQTVVVESSTNLLDWVRIETNILNSGQLFFSRPIDDAPRRFYRVSVKIQ